MRGDGKHARGCVERPVSADGKSTERAGVVELNLAGGTAGGTAAGERSSINQLARLRRTPNGRVARRCCENGTNRECCWYR